MMPKEKIYFLVFALLVIIIPILATFLLYTGIIQKVSVIRKSISSIGRSSASKKSTSDSALLRSIIYFTAALIFAWLPLIVYKFLKFWEVEMSHKLCQTFGKIATLLPWSRTVVIDCKNYTEMIYGIRYPLFTLFII